MGAHVGAVLFREQACLNTLHLRALHAMRLLQEGVAIARAAGHVGAGGGLHLPLDANQLLNTRTFLKQLCQSAHEAAVASKAWRPREQLRPLPELPRLLSDRLTTNILLQPLLVTCVF